MHDLSHFFSAPAGSFHDVISGSYNVWLVLLSVGISIFSSVMALRTAEMARSTETRNFRLLALGMGTLSLGGGIWAMHFIGMLAYSLPVPVEYSISMTLVSLLPACLASGTALHLLSHREVSIQRLLTCGVIVGAGIGVMHYVGMAAMQLALHMYYQPSLFALSIVVAVILACIALWIWYGVDMLDLGPWTRLIFAGAIMGAAIAGMHYTGMSAIRYYGEIPDNLPPSHIHAGYLALALSLFIVSVSVMVVALNGLIRTRELYLAMQAGRSRLKAILDTAVDGVITIDTRGIIQEFNPAAERLFGYAEEEVIGCNIKMLMPDPDRSKHDNYLGNFLRTGEKKVIGVGREVVAMRKDGSHVPIRLAVGEIILHCERLFVGFVSDISERHALEVSLREEAARAERAAATKTAFLANMSHEIRTPMNAIIGFAQLLLDTEMTPQQRNYLSTIHQSSHSLLRLINDILDTTKMEQQEVTLEQKPFSLKAIAMQLESSLGLGAREKGLKFTLDYPSNVPEYFVGDQLRVLQILTNLVGNAIKFTESGGVTIRFRYQTQLQIEIEDTGIGMTKAQQDSVFSPFTQADSSISRRFGGTGLGTTIAQQLVTHMNGQIALDSQLGKGTIFSLQIPLPATSAPQEHDAETVVELPPLEILIADDVTVNIELLTVMLNRAGHTVVAATNGKEVVAQYQQRQFDLVLMDMHMPLVDGLAATKQIRQFEQQHARMPVPIIALTASVMLEDQQAATRVGMNGFAVKPLDAKQLFREMARVLRLTSDSEPTQRQTQPQTLQQINWEQGLALWGSAERFRSALAQFFNDMPNCQLLNNEHDGTPDWPKTRQLVHRLVGVSGNLAMEQIHQLAKQTEQLLRAEQYAQAQANLQLLRQRLHDAKQCYGDEPQSDTTEVVTPAASAIDDGLQRRITTLHDVLSHSELDDELLHLVCTGLENAGHFELAQQLKKAVDAFEFERACQLLADCNTLD